MLRFEDAEAGYLDWIARHPRGWVLNVGRTLAPSIPLVLHRASRARISTARENYTTGAYVKICSPDRAELTAWARRYAEPSAGCHCLGRARAVTPTVASTGRAGRSGARARTRTRGGTAPRR